MERQPLHLYTVFHLNLAYSSIEEDQHARVMKECYWPLIRMAKLLQLPLGIEASGYTLEVAARLDPRWLDEMRELVTDGPCEFVGSGYAQLIGPLVPAMVNEMNLRLGHQVYEELLGIRPHLAFVSEQAYSCGLVPHYLGAQYDGIIMEWENAAHAHPEWDSAWQYVPQVACGPNGEEIPVLWNRTLAFQNFQRFVHGEMTRGDYGDYLDQQRSSMPRSFPLYGNDVEIFGFRPGRYHTEAPLHPDGEWKRMRHLFEVLKADDRWLLVQPGEVLAFNHWPGAGHRLHLESAISPIPVKKQAKYNVFRWGVTGRNDAHINAACWRIYETLIHSSSTRDEDWRELCYLWSSDFRTHITETRWQTYLERLQKAERQYGTLSSQISARALRRTSGNNSSNWCVKQEGAFFIVDSDSLKLRLNCLKGLAIDRLWLKAISPHPIIRTLPHGFFDDISMGADYFSGHLTFETPAEPKITDLVKVNPKVSYIEDGKTLLVEASIETRLGPLSKYFVIHPTGEVNIRYELSWKDIPPGVLRLGYMTLNPEAFQFPSLQLETHNGGFGSERYSLHGQSVDHGMPVSFLVSANNGFGYTKGVLRLHDEHIQLAIRSDQGSGYLLPLLSVYHAAPSYFCRVSFSAMEFDDTSRVARNRSPLRAYELGISASRWAPIMPDLVASVIEKEPATC